MSRVMLVEDEPDIRALVRLILEDAGHDVLEADDGETALVTIAARSDVDVLLLDLRLPDMSGWEVMAELRLSGHEGRPAVIVFSAQMEPRDQLRAERKGAVGYVTKPFTEEALLAAVSAAAG